MSLQTNTASLTALLESVNALPDKIDTSGTATAADIYTGKTATVNDTKLTGTNPYNAANVDPAVTSALAAIAEKGVDTTGKGLADIAGLVAAIEAGGGGTKVAYGTIQTAEDTIELTISHALGIVPDLVFYWRDRTSTTASDIAFAVSKKDENVFSGKNALSTYSNTASTWMLRSPSITLLSEYSKVTQSFYYPYGVPYEATSESFRLGVSNQSFTYRAGTSYHWVAIGGLS